MMELNKLPTEVLCIIYKKLSLEDLKSLSETCRRQNEICHYVATTGRFQLKAMFRPPETFNYDKVRGKEIWALHLKSYIGCILNWKVEEVHLKPLRSLWHMPYLTFPCQIKGLKLLQKEFRRLIMDPTNVYVHSFGDGCLWGKILSPEYKSLDDYAHDLFMSHSETIAYGGVMLWDEILVNAKVPELKIISFYVIQQPEEMKEILVSLEKFILQAPKLWLVRVRFVNCEVLPDLKVGGFRRHVSYAMNKKTYFFVKQNTLFMV